mmetsp:Transcript_127944/g.356075  ORF Transcript_127944/g.356075 Transcript_127944/m.356075 type:complete len:119 (+) Transcript_127944:181-537(+)
MAEGNLTAKSSGSCSSFAEEIRDIFAFRHFLQATWEQPSASATLVAFHNLVTATVHPDYRTPECNHAYCANQVVTELHQVSGVDLIQNLSQLLPATVFGSVAEFVPGLGPHAGPECGA